jgi:hypothetical protein
MGQAAFCLPLFAHEWPGFPSALIKQLINQNRVAIDQASITCPMPNQMELTPLVVDIDAHLAVGQRGVSLGQDQLKCVHVDIDHEFTAMSLLQVFFSLFQAPMEGTIDVKMNFTHWFRLFCTVGFAPAFDRQGTHDEISVVDGWPYNARPSLV